MSIVFTVHDRSVGEKRNNIKCLSSWCKGWTCSKQFQASQQCWSAPLVMDFRVFPWFQGFNQNDCSPLWSPSLAHPHFLHYLNEKTEKNKSCLFLASLFYRWQSHVQPSNLTRHWHEWRQISALNINISSSPSCDELIYLYPDFKLYQVNGCQGW